MYQAADSVTRDTLQVAYMDSTPNLFASGSDDATIKVCQQKGRGVVGAYMQARPPPSYWRTLDQRGRCRPVSPP